MRWNRVKEEGGAEPRAGGRKCLPPGERLGLKSALALILAIHMMAAFFLLRLEFNNAPDLYFLQDSPAARLDRELRAEFPNDETLIGLFAGDDLYGDSFLQAFDRVSRRLEKEPLVDRVFSVTQVDHLVAGTAGFSVERLIDPDRAHSPQMRRERVLNDRFAPGWLATPEGDILAIVVRVKKLTESRQRAAVEQAFYQAVRGEGLERKLVAVTGLVALDVAEMRSTLHDTVLFTPLVMAMGLGLLLWMVGRLAPVVIGAVAVSTVVVSTIALIAAMGQPYTLVTAMVPTLLSAYTISNLLYLYAALQRMDQAKIVGRQRVRQALEEIHKPVLFNLLSTAAGVSSLVLVPIPPVQVFGLSGAFGALMIYLTVFHLVPPLLLRWDCRPWPTGGSGLAWARRIACRLAGFGVRHAAWVLGVGVLVIAVTAPLILKVEVESDLLKFFDDDHPLTRSTRLVESRLLGMTALEIVADGPERDTFKDVDRLKMLKSVQDWAATLPEVDRAVSMVDLVEEMHRAFHGGNAADLKLPTDNRQLAQLLLVYDGKDLPELVNGEYQRARILLNVRVHGANAIRQVILKIEDHLSRQDTPDMRWHVVGIGRLFSDMEALLVTGQVQSFLGAFGVIFLIMLFLWRSLPIAVIGMIPNLAPLFFVFVLMGGAGIYLDTATVLIASVILGITVDDTIHFLHTFHARRKQGYGMVFALMRSFEVSGRAVVAISILLVAQFLLLATSGFQPTAHYGLLAATGLLVGQLLELLMLPALLALWHRWRMRG